MSGFQGREPSLRFCEIINVGRKERGREIRPHDVTIFYKSNSGRGVFEVQGGIIFDSTQSYGRHKITVVAARGYTFGFARKPGGDFEFTTPTGNLWGEKLQRVEL